METRQTEQNVKKNEVEIPVYAILTGIVIAAIIIIAAFAGPLNTSPDQEYPQTVTAEAP